MANLTTRTGSRIHAIARAAANREAVGWKEYETKCGRLVGGNFLRETDTPVTCERCKKKEKK